MQPRLRNDEIGWPNVQTTFSAYEQSRAAKTIEIYGWIIFLQGGLLLLFPDFMANVMHFGPLESAGFWIFVLDRRAGFGIWHALRLSGRLNAEGFVFATLIDRPFIAPTMAALWYFGALPAALALLFAIEDSASWLWTLTTWRAERRLS